MMEMHPRSCTLYQTDRVTVADESLSAFNDLKVCKRSKFIIFALSPEKTPFVVYKTSSGDDYESFLAELPENRCKCAVYDFEYEIGGGEGKRTKIVYYTWTPDTALARSKMVYASSKDALRRALDGVAADIQGRAFLRSRTTSCWSVSAGVSAPIRTASSVSSHSPQYSTMHDNL